MIEGRAFLSYFNELIACQLLKSQKCLNHSFVLEMHEKVEEILSVREVL